MFGPGSGLMLALLSARGRALVVVVLVAAPGMAVGSHMCLAHLYVCK